MSYSTIPEEKGPKKGYGAPFDESPDPSPTCQGDTPLSGGAQAPVMIDPNSPTNPLPPPDVRRKPRPHRHHKHRS